MEWLDNEKKILVKCDILHNYGNGFMSCPISCSSKSIQNRCILVCLHGRIYCVFSLFDSLSFQIYFFLFSVKVSKFSIMAYLPSFPCFSFVFARISNLFISVYIVLNLMTWILSWLSWYLQLLILGLFSFFFYSLFKFIAYVVMLSTISFLAP